MNFSMFFFCTKIVEGDPQKKKTRLTEIASANPSVLGRLRNNGHEHTLTQDRENYAGRRVFGRLEFYPNVWIHDLQRFAEVPKFLAKQGDKIRNGKTDTPIEFPFGSASRTGSTVP